MPGVAQVWFTDDELEALDVLVNDYLILNEDSVIEDVRDKVIAAREGVACPTPRTHQESCGVVQQRRARFAEAALHPAKEDE